MRIRWIAVGIPPPSQPSPVKGEGVYALDFQSFLLYQPKLYLKCPNTYPSQPLMGEALMEFSIHDNHPESQFRLNDILLAHSLLRHFCTVQWGDRI